MIDRLPRPSAFSSLPANTDELIARGCFAATCAVAIVGAFVGLDSFGFWFDELFTLRILEPQPGAGDLLSRIATDVHPPLYPVVLYLYAQVAGYSDAALRSFSALAACAAVLVFVASGRKTFSPSARLFGAALACGSWFWFFQSQNARSYALCLLLSTAILAISLSLVAERSPPRSGSRSLAGLIALMAVGSFVHFYVLYESLAVLIVLAVLRRQDRRWLIVAAAGLIIVATLYVRLVIVPFTQVSLDTNWYQNNPGWYARVLNSCLQYTLGEAGRVALAICAIVALFAAVRGRAAMAAAIAAAPVTLLLVGVPVLVLAGAVVSSTLLAPNFFDRNFLIVSPFFWGIAARLYDAATKPSSPPTRVAVNASLSLIILSMASMVVQRLPSERLTILYEPFRESAEWVRTVPDCRGQMIPVITTDHMAWYKPGFAQELYGSIYGHYLEGFAPVRLISMGELTNQRIDGDLVEELQRRLSGKGCPILGWSVHNVTKETLERAKAELLSATDRPAVAGTITLQEFHKGHTGYALYLVR